MGIYDRDYMRRRDDEPPESPRDISRKGGLSALLIAGGLIVLGIAIRRNSAESEAQRGMLENRDYHMFAKPATEAPPMLKRLLNVNDASAEELDAVPYMSPKMVRGIISLRPFESIEDLKKVPGIKDKTLEQIRRHIMVD